MALALPQVVSALFVNKVALEEDLVGLGGGTVDVCLGHSERTRISGLLELVAVTEIHAGKEAACMSVRLIPRRKQAASLEGVFESKIYVSIEGLRQPLKDGAAFLKQDRAVLHLVFANFLNLLILLHFDDWVADLVPLLVAVVNSHCFVVFGRGVFEGPGCGESFVKRRSGIQNGQLVVGVLVPSHVNGLGCFEISLVVKL